MNWWVSEVLSISVFWSTENLVSPAWSHKVESIVMRVCRDLFMETLLALLFESFTSWRDSSFLVSRHFWLILPRRCFLWAAWSSFPILKNLNIWPYKIKRMDELVNLISRLVLTSSEIFFTCTLLICPWVPTLKLSAVILVNKKKSTTSEYPADS